MSSIAYSSILTAFAVIFFGLLNGYEDFRRVNLFSSLILLVTTSSIKEFFYLTDNSHYFLAEWFALGSRIYVSYTITSVSHVCREVKWGQKISIVSLYVHILIFLFHVVFLFLKKLSIMYNVIHVLFLLSIGYTFYISARYGIKEVAVQKGEKIFSKYMLPFVIIFVFIDAFYYKFSVFSSVFSTKPFFSWFFFLAISSLFIYTSHIKFNQQNEYKEQEHFDIDSRFGLTKRESEICILLLLGKINKDIATDLDISISTVKTHVQNIYKKINVSSRYELISCLSIANKIK